jgi:hypothetical protein
MKKGKTSKITGYEISKITYGTVDSVLLKSLYLNIQTWIEPKYENENWTRVALNLSREIKHSILESLNSDIFNPNYIVDLDLRPSGIQVGKKSFMNLEINFYINEPSTEFKSVGLQSELIKITDSIHKNNFYQNKYFTFHLTKNKNKQEIKQMELA